MNSLKDIDGTGISHAQARNASLKKRFRSRVSDGLAGLSARVLLACVAVLLLATACGREARLDRRLERARRFYENGNYQSAVIEYANALRLDRDNTEALRQLGYCHFESGDFRQAVPFLRATIEREPTNTVAHLRLGTLLLAAGQADMAREVAQRSLKASPDDTDSLILLADASRGADEISAAIALLRSAEARFKNPAGWHLAIGSLHLRLGERDEAEREFAQALTLGGDRPDVHLAYANFHMTGGDEDRARTSLEEAARLAPPDSRAALSLAEYRLRRDDLDGAAEVLNAALAASPDSPPVQYLLARVAFARGDVETCLSLVEKVLQKTPESFPVLLLKANADMAGGNADAAVAGYEKMAALQPKLPRVRFDLARALLLKGDRRRAMAELEQALVLAPDDPASRHLLAQERLRDGNATAAIALLEGVVAREPMVPSAYTLLASAYASANRMPDALTVLTALRDARPQDHEAHLLVGRAQRLNGDGQAAARSFEEALRLKPDYLPALAEWTLLDIAGRDFENALARVRKWIERQPDHVMLHDLLGRVLMLQGDHKGAESAFLKAIELDPAHTGAYMQLVRVYTATGRVAEALARAEAALAGRPNDPMMLMMAAGLYTGRQDDAKAAELYERLLAIRPDFAPAANNLAYLYAYRLDRLADALRLAERARERMPDDPFVGDTLGWILYLQGDVKRAEPLLRDSAAKLPEEPEVLYHLGAVQEALGQERAALDTLERAVAGDASFPGREDARQRLDILHIDLDGPLEAATVERLEKAARTIANPVSVLLRLGAAAEQARDWPRAERQYLDALAVRPDHRLALRRLAALYLGALDAPAKALDTARRYRERAPDDAEALRLLGLAAARSGEHTWAVNLFRDGAATAPDNAAMQYGLGMTAFRAGYVREAGEAFARAVALDPAHAEADEGRRTLSMIRIYRGEQTGEEARLLVRDVLAEDRRNLGARLAEAALAAADAQTTAALTAYEEVIREWPDFAPALMELAALLADDARTQDRALALATKAREQLPQDPAVAAVLGGIASRRGDHKWAVSLLQEAVRGGVPGAATRFHLGASQAALGQKEEARSNLTDALKRADAGFAHAGEARRLLEELAAQ